MPLDALRRRLRYYSDLSADQDQRVADLSAQRRSWKRNSDVIQTGERMSSMLVLEKGWAIRSKTLEDGRRQILNILLPGDIFDLQVLIAAEADHDVSSVTEIEAWAIPPQKVQSLLTDSGPITMAMWWTQVQEEAFLREQIIRNGRRNAREKLAHLLLEIHRRAQIVDEAGAATIDMPLTQVHLADTLGLTPIHTNRVLRWMEKEGLIAREKGLVIFRDVDRLAELCEFDPSYFHLDAFRRRLSFAA